jgi:CubicO group peptidase (beta-lactamase class C family)
MAFKSDANTKGKQADYCKSNSNGIRPPPTGQRQSNLMRSFAMAARHIVLGALLITLFIAPGVNSGPVFGDERPASLPADFTTRVDGLFAKWNRRDIPGCAVGIVHRGQVIYRKGFGSEDLEYQVPNTPQTVFDMSVSPSLTCVCLAMLMDEGKISPEDDLRKFVPEMHGFDPPIRIRDMVRCRSGLWEQIALPILVGWEIAPLQYPYTEADFLTLLAGQKTLPFQPGSRYLYSGSDYFLLGLIVKRVSGQSLAEFAQKRVFAPLGMSRSFLEEDPSRVVEQRAVGHYKQVGDAWHLWRSTAYMVGGGGLNTCVDDLCRWDRNFAHNRLPGGKYLDEFLREGTLLENRYVLDADAAIKEKDPEARRASPPGQYRGLRHRLFTSNAWGGSAAISQFPDQEFTAICLSNNEDISSWKMTQLITDLALGDRLAPETSRTPAPATSGLPTVKLDEAELRDKFGAYRTKYNGTIWRITFHDGTLRLTDAFHATYPLRPLSATRFDPQGPGFPPTAQLIFSRPAAGSPWSLTEEWDLPDHKARIQFQAVDLVHPTSDQLKEYAGRYENDELAAIYRLAVRDGRLWLRVNSRRWEALDATVRDEFVPADIRTITFLRNGKAEVTGLSIDVGSRLTGVQFTKR